MKQGYLFLIAASCLYSLSSFCTDPTIYLRPHALRQHNGRLEDAFGNPMQMQVDGAESAYTRILASTLAQLADVPVNASFATWNIERSPGLPLKQATVQRKILGVTPVWNELTARERAEYVGVFLIGEMLGRDVSNDVVYVKPQNGRGHFVLETAQLATRKGPKSDHIVTALNKAFQSTDESSRIEIWKELSRFLSRTEIAAAKHAERLKSIGGVEATKVIERMSPSRAKLVKASEKTAHSAPNSFLATSVMETPTMLLPKLPTDRSPDPIEVLWSHYFTSKEIATDAATDIKRQMNRANQDMPFGVFEIAPHMNAQIADAEARTQDRVAQPTLSANNHDTLVVVPLNDAEAIEIARIAKEAGAQVLELSASEYPHGAKLDRALLDKIVAFKAKHPTLQRVAVAELPEKTTGLEAELQTALGEKTELFVLDHHAYASDGLDRSHPTGTLEQAAELLGYRLSPSSRAIAVYDSRFVGGVLDLGVQKSELEKMVELSERIKTMPYLKTPHGPLYVLNGLNGPIGEIASALNLLHYPKVPSVLILGEDIRFSGSPKLVEKLRTVVEPLVSDTMQHYWFGDPKRSQGWGLKRVKPEKLKAVLTALGSELGKDIPSITPFFERAVSAAGTRSDVAQGKTGLQDILSIPAPPERTAALKALRWINLSAADRDLLFRLLPEIENWKSLPPETKQVKFPGVADSLNPFDITAILDLAEKSKDPRWVEIVKPMVERWKSVTRGWQTFARTTAEKIIKDAGQPGAACNGPIDAIASVGGKPT